MRVSTMSNPCVELGLPIDLPYQNWKERRLYYRRNKAARYELSNPMKGETDFVYTNEGRVLYGKRPL